LDVKEGEVYAAAQVHAAAMQLIADVPQGSSVLELGCGSGTFLRDLTRCGYQVTGVDAQETAAGLSGVRFLRSDLEKPLPFDRSSFDAVVSIETVEHLWNSYGFLEEALRVLKPGGILVLSTPNIGSWVSRLTFLATGTFAAFRKRDYDIIHHVTPIYPASLLRWVKEKGCRCERIATNGVWIPYLKWRPKTDNLFLGQVVLFRIAK